MVFYIYCKPFDADILKQISSFFEIEKRFNYPTIMAMLPNSMLENPDAVQFIEHIDDLLSGDERFPYGYYTFLCGRKSEQINPAQTDIHRILSDKGIQFELIEHKPVLTLREVRQVLEIDEASMVKTVVLTEGKRRNIRPEEKHYIVVAVKGNRQVDTDVVADALSAALGRSISRGRIDFASRSDLFWLGYPLGGVGPFAINAPKITLMIDAELRASRKKYAYMGSGGNTKTLKMLMRDFKDLTKDYVEIACRDKESTG